MEILSVVGDLIRHHRGDETLSISGGEDERFAQEWCSLDIMGPPHPITHEEVIVSYHLVPVTIRRKSNHVVITHLRWARLDVL